MTLSTIITPSLLHSLRSHPQLPKHAWYIVSSVTLSALNLPDEIPHVFRDAIGADPGAVVSGLEGSEHAVDYNEQLRIARRMREALLKSSAVVGLPKTINALMSLKSVTPDVLLDSPSSPSPSLRTADVYQTLPGDILHRGEVFFHKVYGRISRRIMGQMERSGTEDLGLLARLMYGYLLSNTRVLSATETSFVLIASLVPQDVNPQLRGHLKGAVNNGATVEEVRATRDIVIRICQAAGMKILQPGQLGGFGWREEVASI